jgi:arylsulfatase
MAFTTAYFLIQAPEDLIMKCDTNYLKLGYAVLKKESYKNLKEHGLISHEAKEGLFNNFTKKGEILSLEDKKKQAKRIVIYT